MIIILLLVVHSTYSKKLKNYFSNHGCIFKHDAAEIIWDMVVRHVRSRDLGASFETANPDADNKMKEYRSDMVSVSSVVSCSHELKLGSRTPHYNWAFGVLLYTLMCGPPPNNGCKKHIKFFNNIGLGVTIVQSEWFGSTGKRRKWSQLRDQRGRRPHPVELGSVGRAGSGFKADKAARAGGNQLHRSPRALRARGALLHGWRIQTNPPAPRSR